MFYKWIICLEHKTLSIGFSVRKQRNTSSPSEGRGRTDMLDIGVLAGAGEQSGPSCDWLESLKFQRKGFYDENKGFKKKPKRIMHASYIDRLPCKVSWPNLMFFIEYFPFKNHFRGNFEVLFYRENFMESCFRNGYDLEAVLNFAIN